MSGEEPVASRDDSPCKPVVSDTDSGDFTSQELWDIAKKTITPPNYCIRKEQVESVPETPSPNRDSIDSSSSVCVISPSHTVGPVTPVGNEGNLSGQTSLTEETREPVPPTDDSSDDSSLFMHLPGNLLGPITPVVVDDEESGVEGSIVEETPESVHPLSTSQPSDSSMEVECVGATGNETRQHSFDFSTNKGLHLTGAWTDFKHYPDNFLRGCKWAPDGSCILVNSNDGYLRLFNLPEVFYGGSGQNWDAIPEMRAALKIYDGDLVYDYCWYPLMNSLDSTTSCFASTSRHSPIHMFDAYTGALRCSYRPYNQMDELESAYCLCFSSDGQKLYSGFDKTIRIFDVNIPGRVCETRKTKAEQQTGIISCIAVNPDRSGIYAAGSYLKTTALYCESDGTSICVLAGQQGGVTHLMFSRDGTKLFTGGRKDSEILCWDLRNPGKTLYIMEREVTTNQRIYFDIESTGQYLASGSMNGNVYIWDTWSEISDSTEDIPVLQPKVSITAQEDCTNGASFHPSLPLLATASGQRKFAEPVHSEDSDSDDDASIFTDRYITRDNSLKLWWCG